MEHIDFNPCLEDSPLWTTPVLMSLKVAESMRVRLVCEINMDSERRANE